MDLEIRATSSRSLFLALLVLGVSCGGSAFEAASGDAGVDSTAAGDGASVDGTSVDVIAVGDGASSDGGSEALIDAASGDGTLGDASTGDAGTNETGTNETGTHETGTNEAGTETGVTDAATGDSGNTSDAGGDGGACSAGEVCVTAAPAGWTGPVQFYYGAAAAPACPSGTTLGFSGGTTLTAPPASCSACSCSGAATCDVEIGFYNGAPCSAAPCLDQKGISGACTSGASFACTSSLVYAKTQALPSSGSCTPSSQSPTVPPTSWTDHAQECTPPPAADSCGTSSVCTPAAAAPFQLCVYQSGDVACPSAVGPYSVKQSVDTAVSDSRSCTDCNCGLAAGTSCSGGSVSVFIQQGCDGGSFSLTVPTSCQSIGPQVLRAYGFEQATLSTPTPSSCTPGGGTPTGTATPATPITVCCSP